MLAALLSVVPFSQLQEPPTAMYKSHIQALNDNGYLQPSQRWEKARSTTTRVRTATWGLVYHSLHILRALVISCTVSVQYST